MAAAAQPMAQEKNFLGEGRFLIANKATLVGTIGVDDEPAVKMLQVASCDKEKTYSAGIPGHYFVFGQEPLFSTGEPMRASTPVSRYTSSTPPGDICLGILSWCCDERRMMRKRLRCILPYGTQKRKSFFSTFTPR